MTSLILAWQDPVSRAWVPVGRLWRDNGHYFFGFTQGAERADREFGFQPPPAFPRYDEIYESDAELPFFANRVIRPSRGDYADFVEWLNLPASPHDPIAILARSGGRRVTDSYEVFAAPQPDDNNEYAVHFFAHGMRHLPVAALERVHRARAGDVLRLQHDLQNPVDPNALSLRTDDDAGASGRFLVGYCPRYLAPAWLELMQLATPAAVRVTVERVNVPPAPLQLRLLCELRSPWPDGFQPLQGSDFQLVVPVVLAAP